MDSAERIRAAVARVQALRAAPASDSVMAIKRLQSRRFAGSYADLIAAGGPAADATRFFLEELYGDRDFRERDAQFARIAGTLQTLFPAAVTATAVALAELHALTESLDLDMARAWDALPGEPAARRYLQAWRAVGQPLERRRQLADVLALGRDLGRLTRTPGLGMMLRMMRGPAATAGMGALQRFLEAGFDTFGRLARQHGVEAFLHTVDLREKALMDLLFEGELVACETGLLRLLGEAP
ncbi:MULTISPECIES: hypothetical protein [Ramlibacter]|uniref:DUF8198 domain-containing protein n=1 Tax=Ramlibacter aquaticus TaxID=2780094 RepID=A0ABR9SK25_9BURK|nr:MULTISPECIES: hypothetical protein [Ramlibacter]MBE7942397.1 hypothetical protein [Ramlibacter aquaticus]